VGADRRIFSRAPRFNAKLRVVAASEHCARRDLLGFRALAAETLQEVAEKLIKVGCKWATLAEGIKERVDVVTRDDREGSAAAAKLVCPGTEPFAKIQATGVKDQSVEAADRFLSQRETPMRQPDVEKSSCAVHFTRILLGRDPPRQPWRSRRLSSSWRDHPRRSCRHLRGYGMSLIHSSRQEGT
jgi:hypothetical protein